MTAEILDAPTIGTADLFELLHDLNEEPEPECEMVHVRTVCKRKVVARIIACSHSVNVCETGADSKRAQIADNVDGCAGCKRFVADCWRVISI